MLERPSLWLSAPTGAWPPGLKPTAPLMRRVMSADDRETLGHVAVAPGRRWPWPAGPRIAMFEEPDASLLFRARRLGWWRRVTLVCEADGNTVAYVYDNRVVRPEIGLVAQHRTAGDRGSFVAPNGHDLAGWNFVNGGIQFGFAEELQNEPFTKMGFLAGVLLGT